MYSSHTMLHYTANVWQFTDVIDLRQHVREIARQVGLSPISQAKLAAVISAVGRVIIDDQRRALFTVQTVRETAHPALEVGCATESSAKESQGLVHSLDIPEVRQLSDEFVLQQTHDGVALTIRMRLPPERH